MSLFDSFKKNKKRSTRHEIGAKSIDENGVETYRKEYLVYFLVKPLNIAVLSESTMRSKIMGLMNLLKEVENVELACINSRETFEDNKIYLKERLGAEENQKVREILEKDLLFLDRIQIQTASAREFLIILRFNEKVLETSEITASISRVEKMLKEQGFIAKQGRKADIKRIFGVYFVENLTQIYFEDYDGEVYVKKDGEAYI